MATYTNLYGNQCILELVQSSVIPIYHSPPTPFLVPTSGPTRRTTRFCACVELARPRISHLYYYQLRPGPIHPRGKAWFRTSWRLGYRAKSWAFRTSNTEAQSPEPQSPTLAPNSHAVAYQPGSSPAASSGGEDSGAEDSAGSENSDIDGLGDIDG
ncbi:hypothetical protein VTK56DRAFT_9683 [Thermocarpiscus australiensis]